MVCFQQPIGMLKYIQKKRVCDLTSWLVILEGLPEMQKFQTS